LTFLNSVALSRFVLFSLKYSKQQLTGVVFTTLQELSDSEALPPPAVRLQQVLEKITPDQICSLSSYNFILEALFYAASS
jgi:hypothetical protein